MNCPKCQSEQLVVTDSRPHSDYTYRRRRCLACNHTFSTVEIKKDLYDKLQTLQEECKKQEENKKGEINEP